jgi:energy-coupling factor transporter ATP-binding protein EcfA2
MQISTFQLVNYKSYRDSGELQFSTGFNVLVGQNNAGKSTLLEALGLRFISKPHRSLSALPRITSPVNPTSSAKVVLTVTGEELKDILLSLNGSFFTPIPDDFRGRGAQASQEVVQKILSSSTIRFQVSLAAPTGQSANFQIAQFPSHGLYPSKLDGAGRANYYIVNPTPDRTDFTCSQESVNETVNDFGLVVSSHLRERIYSFRAERFNVGISPVGIRNVLESNAANLPEVLSVLQGNNPSLFAKFNEYVRQIFPTVYQISVRNVPNNQLEVIVWTENPSSQRDDLAVPLAESGTGVGQVLAILYVVLTSQFSRTILIDEPNSFLHPAAARKLIEILNVDFPMHQYIIATHSPEIIRAADPTALFLVKLEGRESKLERVDSKSMKDQSRCLQEVGARLSDVFGSDEIIWVEGDTEEICYRLIIQRVLKKPLLGRAIVAVRNVGDLESKRPSAKMIWEVYSQLSKSNALIPPAIAFVFDREQRTQVERDDLVSRTLGKVKFLPRRMYENFLLLPEAIQAVLSALPSFQGISVTVEEVKEWLETNGGKRAYLDEPTERVDITSKTWLENVNGAKLLRDLFAGLSGNREEYRKTLHSVQLTEWLIQNKPDSLAEMKEFLESILAA